MIQDRIQPHDSDPDPEQCLDCHFRLDECMCEATAEWFDALDQRQAARDAEERAWAEQSQLQRETNQ